MTTGIFYNPKDKQFCISGVKMGNVSHDNDVANFEKCCGELNECINTFAKQQDDNISNKEQPQDTQLSFGYIVSR